MSSPDEAGLEAIRKFRSAHCWNDDKAEIEAVREFILAHREGQYRMVRDDEEEIEEIRSWWLGNFWPGGLGVTKEDTQWIANTTIWRFGMIAQPAGIKG